MKTISVATKYLGRFAGKWVAIDPKRDRVIAAGKTLQEIAPLVTGTTGDKHKIAAAAFKVPRKDEGPYVLILSR